MGCETGKLFRAHSIALDINEWNLYGVSNGTKLILELLRNDTTGIRSVILDSVAPSSISAHQGLDDIALHHLLKLIFNECEKNENCRRQYPNLENRFWKKVNTLNETPGMITIEIPDLAIHANHRITGYDTLGYFHFLLKQIWKLNRVPFYIEKILNDDFSHLTFSLESLITDPEDLSIGALLSGFCTDDHPEQFNSPIDLYDAEVHQIMLDIYERRTSLAKSTCDVWPVDISRAISKLPVSSDIPSLVLAGSFDLVTPPGDSEHAAATLSRSTFIELSGLGHGTLFDQCAQDISQAFIESPFSPIANHCQDEVFKFSFLKPDMTRSVKSDINTKRWLGNNNKVFKMHRSLMNGKTNQN